MLNFAGRGGKVKVWNYEATEALLQLVKANYKRLTDKKTTKAVVWKDITRALKDLVSYYSRPCEFIFLLIFAIIIC